MKKLYLLTLIFLSFFFPAISQDVILQGAANCGAAAVAGSWQVPCGVSSITVEVYGAGGGGGGGGGGSNGGINPTRGGGGGGGGGFTTITINVTPGSSFTYSIGSGGCGGSNGSDLSNGSSGTAGSNSTFSGTAFGGTPVNLQANGGSGGNRGTTSSIGTGTAGGSASGGSTNTTGGNGLNGVGPNPGIGGAGGAGAGPSGGAGGATSNDSGTIYGGAGAGGGNSAGGRGASGAILIYFNGTVTLTPTPIISSTPPNCTAAGTSAITNFSATATYTFTPTGPTVVAGGAINGLTLGTSYTVMAAENGCDSDPSATFSNLAQVPPPSTPVVSTALPTCTSNGVSTITNYNASLTYTFSPTGPAVGAGGVISGMNVGQNYTVLSTDGICSSSASNQFSIQSQLPAPNTPTISNTPPNCTTASSSTISNYSVSASYTFTPTGPSVGAGGLISGMVIGTSYTVTSTQSGCTSAQSASFLNLQATPVPPTPTVSVVAPTCTSNGSAQITNYNSFVTYLFTPSGPSVASNGNISGINFNTAYTVEASDGACNSNSSNSFTILSQLPRPTTSISGSLTYCNGTNTTLTASGGTNYVWYNLSNSNIGSSAAITLTEGSYYVEVSNAAGCNDTANVTVSESAAVVAAISGETEICQGTSTTLSASGGVSYTWSNGQNGQSISVSSSGVYSVEVTDASGCSANSSIQVNQFPTSTINLGQPILACTDSVVLLDAGAGFLSYEWSSSETTQSINPIFSGTYSVIAIDNNNCEITAGISVEFEECLPPCSLFIPDAFTPQGDGTNDFFLTYSNCEPSTFLLSIFNRWGELVFKTSNINEGWDGTFKGADAELGVYSYFLKYQFANNQNERIKKGSVSLIK